MSLCNFSLQNVAWGGNQQRWRETCCHGVCLKRLADELLAPSILMAKLLFQLGFYSDLKIKRRIDPH